MSGFQTKVNLDLTKPADSPPAVVTVADALSDRFSPGATKRSHEYRQGFADMLKRKIEGTPLPPQPYPDGSVQADAYWSGRDDANGYLAARAARGEPLFKE